MPRHPSVEGVAPCALPHGDAWTTSARVLMCPTVDVVPHPAEHASASRPLAAAEAADVAETLKALASPSRLRMVAALLDGERTVEQLAAAVDLSPSATSHNLRILRSLRLVRARRAGRYTFYGLHHHHIPHLLAALPHPHQHVPPPHAIPLTPPEPAAPDRAASRAHT